MTTSVSLASNETVGKFTPDWESLDKRPLPQWYDDSKIGIFLHWGVFSVPSYGTEWFWHRWVADKKKDFIDFMGKNYRPGFTYGDFASQFTAEFYDPKHWADVFKASGAKYVVLTTKHHEGFTLWPSKVSYNWNAMDVGPNRDLVGDLATAVRESGLRFGVYHSLYEWFNPFYLKDKDNNFTTNTFVTTKVRPELEELVNAYKPDVIWSDGSGGAKPEYWETQKFLAWLYNESPVKDSVVVNDRWGTGTGGKHGDFFNYHDRYNPGVIQKHKWENAMTIDKHSWGYRRDAKSTDYLSIHDLLTTLAQTISCGGNLLVNVGPSHDGVIKPVFEDRLRDLGHWLSINGEAVYESKPWTHQNDTLTPGVHKERENMLSFPKNNDLELGSLDHKTVQSILLLGDKKELVFKAGSGTSTHITFPHISPDTLNCLLLASVSLASNETVGKFTPDWESLDKRPLPSWYDESKIGIFIHWGVFSVPSFGTEWFWQRWIEEKDKNFVDFMAKNYRPGFTYGDFASQFTAEFYDPKHWADVFKASGAKYVVLTTKHHEGFTLWPSKVSYNWNAMDVGPKRDLVGDLATAVRESGLHFGVYHSLFEWFNPFYLKDKENNFKTNTFVTTKARPELEELVNTYKPDLIWSDGDAGPPEYWESQKFMAWLYNDSPIKDKVVVNDRWGTDTAGKHGDFFNFQDKYNPGVIQKHKWENAMTLDKYSWGYRRDAKTSDYLSINDLLTTLAQTISCGGNLLVNVGPSHDGVIKPVFEDRLRDLGHWLSINGEAVYESKPWTHANDTLTPGVYNERENYLLYYINNDLELGSLDHKTVQSIQLLGDNTNLTFKAGSGTSTHITFPYISPDSPIKWAYTLWRRTIDRALLTQTLPQFTAELYDPKHWAEVFKASGAKYVVLTAKHHEGFTLWPSKVSYNWNAMDVGPNRDLVGDLATAVRSAGLYFGVYHSLFEWFNPLYLKDKENNFTTNTFVTIKTRPELEELVNAYKPDIIWSDGDWGEPEYWQSQQFLAWLYNDSPVKDKVVVNDRWGPGAHGKHGDFFNFQDRYNPGVIQKHKWENAMTLDKKSRGYRREAKSEDYLSIHDLLTTLAKTISCGGNLLINIGPSHDGVIKPVFEDRLRDLGHWLSINGEAIYESKPWTHANDTKTAGKEKTVYSIVLFWPKNNDLELGSLDHKTVQSIQLLGDNTDLTFKAGSGTSTHITFPYISPDSPIKWWKEEVEFMAKNYRPGFTYGDFAAQFTAEFYDPKHWADVFKASGAKYVVLTAKHHEGFTLWPSKVSYNWNAMDVGPNRDFGDLAAAVRESGLHFGVYHSLFEWFNPYYLNDTQNNYTTKQFVKIKTRPELEELVNTYKPDVIWSDGVGYGKSDYWEATDFLAWLYNHSPVKDTVVVNDRWGNTNNTNLYRIYDICNINNERRLMASMVIFITTLVIIIPVNNKWENALTLDRKSWGYRRDARLEDYLTTHDLLTQLAQTISCGGNLLINVGPSHDGVIKPVFEDRLRDLGHWLSINGEAIYASKPWTHQNDTLTAGVWYTKKEKTNNDLELGSLDHKTVQSIQLLGDNTDLTFKVGSNTTTIITFPHISPDGPIKWSYAQRYTPDWSSLDSRPTPSWFDDAKIGIFIHWGCPLMEMNGFGQYQWKWDKRKEWLEFMAKNYRPGFTYGDFAPQFTAEFYDPKHWAHIFKASGAKYVVLTAKHHDGFALWPSNVSYNWNAMDVGPNRDLVGDLAIAVRKAGLRFGVYHSLLEWFNPYYVNDRANNFQTNTFVKIKARPGLEELVNSYKPDIIWSDGGRHAVPEYWETQQFLAWLYNDSPVKDTVVVNDRWGTDTGGKHGDFHNHVDRFNPGVLQNHKWENAMSLDKFGWGYRRIAKLRDYITIRELLATLAKTISCGGNLLINIGPSHDGVIKPIFEDRLRDLGHWLSINGEAIYESKPWIYQNDTLTSRNNDLELGSLDHKTVQSIQLLGDNTDLTFKAGSGTSTHIIFPYINPDSPIKWAYVLKITTI
ncbi:unnamed protein product [Medioppia subpectinata]|uniref:Putative alpha-L-fucosidase n=1 Tax=Medioppia subpectinata TaxID=1979941 RepID=A0A7R9PTF8_9ACAR|nr:unnamed protein product [Medioppia subpectinata]CAG2100456.1 unnamed protein product [Medioppia subpectinata]